MHSCTTPVLRKRLVDPAACGVRLGVELRTAAEQEAYGSGMCLSHWIKKVVEEALSNSARRRVKSLDIAYEVTTEPESDPVKSALDAAFAADQQKREEL